MLYLCILFSKYIFKKIVFLSATLPRAHLAVFEIKATTITYTHWPLLPRLSGHWRTRDVGGCTKRVRALARWSGARWCGPDAGRQPVALGRRNRTNPHRNSGGNGSGNSSSGNSSSRRSGSGGYGGLDDDDDANVVAGGQCRGTRDVVVRRSGLARARVSDDGGGGVCSTIVVDVDFSAGNGTSADGFFKISSATRHTAATRLYTESPPPPPAPPPGDARPRDTGGRHPRGCRRPGGSEKCAVVHTSVVPCACDRHVLRTRRPPSGSVFPGLRVARPFSSFNGRVVTLHSPLPVRRRPYC